MRARALRRAFCAMTLALGASNEARAATAELPRPDEAADLLFLPAFLANAHPRWTAEHRNQAAVVGELLVWPSATIGGVFDSNPFQQHRGAHGAAGVAVAPQLLAEREAGPVSTDLYAAGDLRLYPGTAQADALDGRAGVLHNWEISRDMTVRLQGEVARRTDPFDNAALVAAHADRGLIFETDVLGAASVQKSFDRMFVAVSGTALRASFDASHKLQAALNPRSLTAETVGTLKARVGYVFATNLYAFAEPALDWRSLDLLPRAAMGTRTVAGLGLLRLGLFGGEAFAGWQQQDYARDSAVSEPVVGGRIVWSPDAAWHVAAQFDESLGEVAVATVADPLGTATRERTLQVSVAYALSPLWRTKVEAGSVWIDYVGSPRSDQLIFGDVRVDYALSRSIDLTGVLRVFELESSVPAAAYGKAAATLAATYHY